MIYELKPEIIKFQINYGTLCYIKDLRLLNSGKQEEI